MSLKETAEVSSGVFLTQEFLDLNLYQFFRVQSFQWIFFFINWSNNSFDLILILAFTMPDSSKLSGCVPQGGLLPFHFKIVFW